MIGYLWAGFICIAILLAALKGEISAITPSIFKSAEQAVTVAFGLIGLMAFWLGIMKIIEESGIMEVLKKLLRPLALFLFPRVPRDHPAMSAILMNMSANLLGMGNAATPFGLRAMEELQKLNPCPEEATDEMCTFLALNTSSLTLLPTTVIALRAATGSLNPTEIVGTTIVATTCSTLVALVADRIFRGRRVRS
ncbi:MAG: nucleoside recognition domain-containing protein [Dethiobacteria bacterium]|nr:nucleoside recognition protein [Bacillota bacterium]HOP69225.1 nucleoside recognition domain-containing protein [Bacillota bacterium]HPT34253.1 nucleoside recognition domain-containing protein [Bacillota bacterium]HPZ64235.1 nucleoside recognition domain-containing protein [Bacillota bacterium]HQD05690.1 nucleoside recognition domain-containing protein [Bacillota bacterium]